MSNKQPQIPPGPYVIGIDQAFRLFGITVIRLSNYQPVYGRVYRSDDVGRKRLQSICEFVTKLIKFFKPVAIGREGIVLAMTAINPRDAASSLQMAGMAYLIDWWIQEVGYTEDAKNYFVLTPGTWRKICLGVGRLPKNTSYLSQIAKITGMTFDDDNLADSYFIAKAAATIYKIIHDEIMPWDVFTTPEMLAALMDKDYCKRSHTGAETVARKIIKENNLELFKSFSMFHRPSWGRRFPIDINDKFSKSRIVTDGATIRKIQIELSKRKRARTTINQLNELNDSLANSDATNA